MEILKFYRRRSGSVVLTALLSVGLAIFIGTTAVAGYLCFAARGENQDLAARNGALQAGKGDLEGRYRELDAQKSGLEIKYKTLEADRDNVVAQLEETQKELASAQARLAEKARVPFSVTYRNAIIGPGLVLQITNRSEKALSAVATFVDPTLNKQKTMNLVLRPGQVQQIGFTDGWAFASGNQITITNADFAPLVVNIP